MLTLKRSAAALVAALAAVLLIGCEEIPGAGSSAAIRAPESIIGRVVVATVTDKLTACTAEPGTEAELWFVDENTIRGFRSDGHFDHPTTSWSYTRDGPKGTAIMNWANGTRTRWDLYFTTETSGLLEGWESNVTFPECRAHYLATFRFAEPGSE